MEVRESGDGAEVFEGAGGGCLGLRRDEGVSLGGRGKVGGGRTFERILGLRGFWRDWEYTL